MPYKSVRQRAWAHTDEGTKKLGGPDRVAEWDESSKALDLPVKVGQHDAHPQHPKARRASLKKGGS